MTERFSRQEFEDALSELPWENNGFRNGEYTYLVRIPNKRIAVLIRSSIKQDGFAALSGDDSIRLVLINTETEHPLAEKIDAWTQRTVGWQKRMIEKIKMLYKKGTEMSNCPVCNTGVMVKKEGKFGVFYGCSNYPSCKHTSKIANAPVITQPEPTEQNMLDVLDAVDSIRFDTDFDFTEDYDEPIEQKPEKKIKFNDQQTAYITAPVDANIRVMASPGSGKTTATVERIVYLINNGVNPNSIVYVTFTKAMADEGAKRIIKRLPEVAESGLSRQICTIHALCFRLLMWEGIKRNVPKDWEVKAALNTIIAGDYRQNVIGEWQYASVMPGYKEVLYWIDKAKSEGMTPEQDQTFFARHMVSDQAAKVHNCRVRFDEWLSSKNYLTFSDMLYMVEQRLINDIEFREKYQRKFTHVLVDEAQDVNYQALRVLITLSLEPGDNRVYRNWLKEN